MYDLIVIEPDKRKKKIIIIAVVVVILLMIAIGVYYKISKKENLDNKNNINDVQLEANVEGNNEKEKLDEATKEAKKQKHVGNVNYLPNYTEASKERMKNIYHSNEKVVYLTFDDGPSKSVTPLILDLLKQENVKATFFVLGSRVEKNPSLVLRAYNEGHYIANHGYSHVYKDIYSSPQAVLDEYNRAQDVIKKALNINYDGHLFRFPGGATGGKYRDIKNEAKVLLNNNNISYIDWNALSQDAAGAKTKESLIENVKNTVGEKQSVVILMHDAGDKILTYETLPDVIAYLREKGYAFKNFYDVIY